MPKPTKTRVAKPRIKITENGPYLLSGLNKITEKFIMPDDEGASAEYKDGQTYANLAEPVALCRCGKTKDMPFCDGTHEHTEFDGTTTAPHTPIMDGANLYKGQDYTLADNELYCAFARFCDALGRVWNLIEFGPDAEKTAVKVAHRCCAGRLMIIDNQTGQTIEPNLPYEVSVLQDPAIGVSGPIYAQGGIEIEDENGKIYEVRNRQTLCRCGASDNKPFCNGAHASIRFNDGKKTPRRRKP